METRNMVPRRWTIDDNEKPFTMNKERTWHYYTRAQHVKAVRERFAWLALSEKIPKLEYVCIDIVPLVTNIKQTADPAAHYPTAKAAIDGLVDANILDDDNDKHIESITFWKSVKWKHDGLRLVITELTNKGKQNG
tara:strand:+ start:2279 stop:2686 length:408 start_codon:yes stop_codon:yes gene_type:complete